LQEERFIGIAPWGASVSCLHQSALLGQGLLWRSLGRSLRANAVRVRLGLGLAAGGGAASPSVLAPVTKNLPVLVRYAAINQQKTRRCGMPSLSDFQNC